MQPASTSTINSNHSIHISALDGIRALAACVIVLYHAKLPGLPGGYMAVDVFFVLSGFLITGIVLRDLERGRFSWPQFTKRRLARLWPALLLFLLVYVITAPLIFEGFSFTKHLRDAWVTATYVVNYASAFSEHTAMLGHVWTLAVEMQFYLLWPLLLILLVRLPRPLAVTLLIVLWFIATGNRWLQSTPDSPWSFYVRTDARASGLILGAILAFVQIRLHQQWALAGCLLLTFSLTFYSTQWIPSARYGFTLAELGAALLVLSRPAILAGPFWSWLATLSYSWYLWHYYLMKILQRHELSWELVLILGAGGGLLAAWLSHRFVEQRFYQPSNTSIFSGRR